MKQKNLKLNSLNNKYKTPPQNDIVVTIQQLSGVTNSSRGGSCPGHSRQGGAKQPHQKYFMTNEHKWVSSSLPNEPKVAYRNDMVRDAILTCAQKLTKVSLIYRIEPKAKK